MIQKAHVALNKIRLPANAFNEMQVCMARGNARRIKDNNERMKVIDRHVTFWACMLQKYECIFQIPRPYFHPKPTGS